MNVALRIAAENLICIIQPGTNNSSIVQFKYLGHVIGNRLVDDQDINKELKNLFMRTNMLYRRFNRCNVHVKVRLFPSFCICFYDAGLWCNFTNGAYSKLTSAYNRCVKILFGFDKYASVTSMFVQLGLPSFNTLMHIIISLDLPNVSHRVTVVWYSVCVGCIRLFGLYQSCVLFYVSMNLCSV